MTMPSAPDWYYTKPDNVKRRTGAGGVVARLADDKVLIALIRDHGDHEYVLPKGGVEHGETLEQAAVREIEEEAGFNELKLLGELGSCERLAGKKSVWQTTHYFLFLTTQTAGTPTDHRNWQVDWFEIHNLPPMYWREQERLIRDNLDLIKRLVRGTEG